MAERVIIKLSEKPNNGDHTDPGSSTSGKPTNITVKLTNDPQGSNFYRYKYEHKDYYGGNKEFNLIAVKDDQRKNVGASGDHVLSVSAYYWKDENGPGGGPPTKALLVEVVCSGSDGTKYYARSNGGDQWFELYGISQLHGEFLEIQLDDLNCKHNKAVTMDIDFINSNNFSEQQPKNPSKEHTKNRNNRYCCEYHDIKENGGKNGGAKITVKRQEVSCQIHHDS